MLRQAVMHGTPQPESFAIALAKGAVVRNAATLEALCLRMTERVQLGSDFAVFRRKLAIMIGMLLENWPTDETKGSVETWATLSSLTTYVGTRALAGLTTYVGTRALAGLTTLEPLSTDAIVCLVVAGEVNLLEKLVNVGVRITDRSRLFILACSYGHAKVAQWLATGVSDTTEGFYTAVRCGHLEVVDLLWRECRTKLKIRPDFFSRTIVQPHILQWCLDKVLPLPLPRGQTLLDLADGRLVVHFAERGLEDIVRRILDHTKNDRFSQKVLDHAIRAGQCGVVKMILERNSSIDRSNVTWLVLAVESNHLPMVNLLLQSGCTVTSGAIQAAIRQKKGALWIMMEHCPTMLREALQHAVQLDCVESVKLLLQRKPDNLNEALASACGYGAETEPCRGMKVISLLLQAGARVNQQPDMKFSPLYLAVISMSRPRVSLLLEYGADIHAEQDAALHLACQQEDLDMMKLLLEHGAFRSQTTWFGIWTAYDAKWPNQGKKRPRSPHFYDSPIL